MDNGGEATPLKGPTIMTIIPHGRLVEEGDISEECGDDLTAGEATKMILMMMTGTYTDTDLPPEDSIEWRLVQLHEEILGVANPASGPHRGRGQQLIKDSLGGHGRHQIRCLHYG
ncbi:uncharacterized protein LOC117344051 isoform X2 [Pecten maximus]|uniref:uncharacterized protein LOC117344051 isoform X2 n=1 Tax=Pecten maximus TaxID=6579 RepID=UPI0014582832|nr:uncharacterized protein LOC117344051 isoform X2 [Pecten maximus]